METAIEIRILGPLEVEGVPPAALGGPRQRSLLALLAANHGRPVVRDRVIDGVWSDPPASAISTIQGYVSHLRRAFAGSALTISFAAGAYTLRGPDDLLDARRFEAIAAWAEGRLASGRPDDAGVALEALEVALGLWRGPALDGFLDCPFAPPVANRLEQRRLEAAALRARALLGLGRARDAVSWLGTLVDEQPYDEELCRLLMLALYGAGRQGDALALYRATRGRLRDELGVDPGPALEETERQILKHDAGLPRPLVRPAGVAQPDRLTIGGPHGTTQTPWPVHPTSFVGRRPELRRLDELVVRHPVVTLTGPGGVGKTRLALAGAERLAGLTPLDLVAFVDAALADGADALLAAVARSVSDLAIPATLDAIGTAVARQRVLLVLDSCERLAGPCGRLVSELMRRTEGLRVLATSREPLGIATEAVWEVPPLQLPPAGGDERAALAADAVQLFLARAPQLSADPVLEPGHLDAIAEIVGRTDGLPLAIELAAGVARTLALTDVRDRLRGVALLAEEIDDATTERHRSLGRMIDWSYRLLSRDQRRLFTRLGGLRAPFGLADVEAVCCDDQLRPATVVSLLSWLIRRSLVTRRPREQERPYRLLEPLREFAALHLATSRPDTAGSIERHRAHFVALARRARSGLHGEDPVRWARLLEQTEPDLVAAAETCRQQQDQDGLAAITLALVPHWVSRYRLGAADDLLRSTRTAVGDVHPSQVDLARELATVAHVRDDFHTAREHCADAIARAERAGDPVGLGYSLVRLAEIVRSGDNDPAAAMGLLLRAQDLAQEHEDARLDADARRLVAMLHWDAGRLAEAEREMDGSRRAARRAHDARGAAETVVHLAGLACQRGRYAEAEALYEEAAVFYGAAGDPLEGSYIVYGLARTDLHQQRWDRAAARAAEALGRFERIGDDWGAGISRRVLGEAELRRGRLEPAGVQLRRSLRTMTERGFADDIAASADLLAQWALARGDRAQAEQLLEGALERLGIAPTRQRGPLLRTLAAARWQRGDCDAARRLATDALAACRLSGSAAAVRAAEALCAEIAVATGHPS